MHLNIRASMIFQLVSVLFVHVAVVTSTYKSDQIHNEISKQDCSCMIGPAGTPGVPGVPGMHGLRGQDGHKGDKGTQGDRGRSGEKGNYGQDGPRGPPGLNGDKGRRGRGGVKGPKGNTGSRGERGQRGTKGQSGTIFAEVHQREKIAFSVARSMKLGPVLQETTVNFDRVFSNVGGHFNEYTSHFVCKTNGTYAFHIHVLGQHNKNAFAWIMKNKNHEVPLHGDGGAGYGTGSNTIILTLHKEDHVWIQLTKDSALMNDYSTFSGYLLFEE